MRAVVCRGGRAGKLKGVVVGRVSTSTSWHAYFWTAALLSIEGCMAASQRACSSTVEEHARVFLTCCCSRSGRVCISKYLASSNSLDSLGCYARLPTRGALLLTSHWPYSSCNIPCSTLPALTRRCKLVHQQVAGPGGRWHCKIALVLRVTPRPQHSLLKHGSWCL